MCAFRRHDCSLRDNTLDSDERGSQNVDAVDRKHAHLPDKRAFFQRPAHANFQLAVDVELLRRQPMLLARRKEGRAQRMGMGRGV